MPMIKGRLECWMPNSDAWIECDMNTREAKHDARGIFLCYVCRLCEHRKLSGYRPDVLTDPNYWHDEPIEEDE